MSAGGWQLLRPAPVDLLQAPTGVAATTAALWGGEAVALVPLGTPSSPAWPKDCTKTALTLRITTGSAILLRIGFSTLKVSVVVTRLLRHCSADSATNGYLVSTAFNSVGAAPSTLMKRQPSVTRFGTNSVDSTPMPPRPAELSAFRQAVTL